MFGCDSVLTHAEPARDDTHAPRSRSPDGNCGEDTAAHGDPERAHVIPSAVVQHPRHPRPKSGPDPRCHTQGAEDRAIVAPLENLGGNRDGDRGEPIAEKPLGRNHHVEPPRHRPRVHQQEGRIRAYEPRAAHAPRPLPTDAIGQIPHRDLPRDAREGHEAERPHGGRRHEAHFYEVLGLVNLHAVPGESKSVFSATTRYSPKVPATVHYPRSPTTAAGHSHMPPAEVPYALPGAHDRRARGRPPHCPGTSAVFRVRVWYLCLLSLETDSRKAGAMGKLTYGMNLSLDGYIAAPGDDI